MPESPQGSRLVRHKKEFACCRHCGPGCDDLHLHPCAVEQCADGRVAIDADDPKAYDARHARANAPGPWGGQS